MTSPVNPVVPRLRLLTVTDFCLVLSCSRMTFYRRLRSGSIPPPIRLGGSTSHPRWRADVIEAWLAARTKEETSPCQQQQS